MIRLLLSEVNPGAAQELAERLAASGQIEVVGFARDGLEAAQMIAQMKPDVAIIHTSLPGMDGYSAVHLASLANPDTASILLADGEPNSVERGMRAGARAVLSANASIEEIAELVEELAQLAQSKQQLEYSIITDPAKMPVTIAVTGAKGGSGKTTTATNLALCLAKRFPNQVVIVDFFGQFGDVSLQLDLSLPTNIAQLSSYNELDPDLVERHLGVHDSTLRVLAAPTAADGLNKATSLDVAYLANLLGILRRKYRFVIFDIPPLVSEVSEYIFSRCTFIIVVATLTDLASIRDSAELLALLEKLQIPRSRIKLIANQDGANKQFTVRDLEETTNYKVSHRIPYDGQAVVRAINEGIPICVGQPGSPVARSYEAIVDALLSELPGAAKDKKG